MSINDLYFQVLHLKTRFIFQTAPASHITRHTVSVPLLFKQQAGEIKKVIQWEYVCSHKHPAWLSAEEKWMPAHQLLERSNKQFAPWIIMSWTLFLVFVWGKSSTSRARPQRSMKGKVSYNRCLVHNNLLREPCPDRSNWFLTAERDNDLGTPA